MKSRKNVHNTSNRTITGSNIIGSERMKKKIPYWRDLSFQSLDNFSKELKIDLNFSLLAEYAKLKEKGLRKQAFSKLNEFIILAHSFDDSKKHRLVQLICQTKLNWGANSDLFDSYPLTSKIIVPTLMQWISDEPQNPEPLKWLGLFYSLGSDRYLTALEQSLSLNPEDDVVRKELISRYLSQLEYSTHHLNENFYIGNPSDDLKLCLTIRSCLKDVQDKNAQTLLSEELEKYSQMIQDTIKKNLPIFLG